MIENSFSFLTLSPIDTRDKKMFWDYRIEEIRGQSLLLVIFAVIVWVASLLILCIVPSQQQLANFAHCTLSCIFLCSIALASRVFSSTFIYLIPIQYVLIKLVQLIGIKTWASDSSLEIEEWSVQRHLQSQVEAQMW